MICLAAAGPIRVDCYTSLTSLLTAGCLVLLPGQHFVLDFTPVPDIDTTGIMALNESRQHLEKRGVQVSLAIRNCSGSSIRYIGNGPSLFLTSFWVLVPFFGFFFFFFF